MTARPTGTPRLLRALNDRAALELLLEHGPLTRTRLGELSGLSKVTASQLLARVEAAGLVRSVGAVTGTRGPHARLYALDASAGHAAGVDVDPRRVQVRLVDLAGTVVGQTTQPLPRDTAAHEPGADVARAIDAAARDAGLDPHRVGSVVVGVQGSYDPRTDTLAHAEHMPAWSRPGLLAGLGAALRATVTVDNDVNLAAAADADERTGPAPGCSVLLWAGDGLGLAVQVRGELHHGARGGAGEVGYVRLPGPGGEPVTWQDLAGGPALRELAVGLGLRARTAQDAVSRAVTRAAQDAAAATFLDTVAQRLATGLAVVTSVLDPDEVVLAGPVCAAGGDMLAARVAERLPRVAAGPALVRPTTVQGNAVLAGATALAVSTLREQLFSTTTQPRTGRRTRTDHGR